MDIHPEYDDVIGTISASPTRRWMGVLSLYGLGILLIYVAFMRPPTLGWQVFLIVVGILSMLVGDKMRRATEVVIELTEEELREKDGVLIARVEDIQSVDRGFFAFKPSNGFLIRTRASSGARIWRPGMWWRVGRQIGIGGVTPGNQSKFVAEILQMMLAKRDQDI